MDSRTLILIAGANQGLGYYAAQQLASTGKYKVLIGSRDISKTHKAIQTLIEDESVKITPEALDTVQLDVDSDISTAAAAQHVVDKYGRLDILLNNPAIASGRSTAADGSGPSLRDLYRAQYETNVFAPAVVTDAFLPLLSPILLSSASLSRPPVSGRWNSRVRTLGRTLGSIIRVSGPSRRR